MATPLEVAIQQAWDAIAAYNPGTSLAPAAGSSDYFRLRALVVGHAYLLRLQALGCENDLAAVERVYRGGTAHFNAAEIPPVVPVVVETLTPVQQTAVAAAIASGRV